MISRLASYASLTIAALFFTSCGSTGIAVIPKSKINGADSGNRNFTLPGPSSSVLAAANNKPRDKHSMPVYTFSERTRVVRTTAYTCSEDDHLIYGSSNATGTQLRYTNRVRSAAADWSFYPVGTTFRIKGLPYLYVVDDYGSALTGTGTVDIYKPTKEIMNLWGRRTVEMTIVQWGSFNRSAEILSKRTKFPHCSQMLANIVRQRPDLGRLAMR
ncbi:MAG: 3D domain-containing protein [Luteolibacter sp.]|jgi:3D (Asp-Asp-Asp) domain-containing protein|nr:3D domain-containing protein [Luteolibacter sp.]